MSNALVTNELTFSAMTCCYDGCGVVFALGNEFIRLRKEDHAWWYCPNGHRQHWSQSSEKERLQAEVDRLKETARWREDQLRAARNDADTQRRRAAAARGQVTKIKNKVANGVCPVPGCKRSFTNVLAHLRTAHPDYHRHEEN